MEALFVVICVGWLAFVIYLWTHHPETAKEMTKRAQESQDKILGVAGEVVKTAVVVGVKAATKR